jgi:SAM-dependent methyltransferase
MREFLRHALELLLRLDPNRQRADLRWWERRVRRRGARSVFHRAHRAEDLPRIDQWQKEILFPILRERLRGDERVVLDFGCGPGRFTADLARMVDGRAIGVDPIQALLDLAPKSEAVEYRRIEHGRIPLEDASVDVVWICLVLTCITSDRAVRTAVSEVDRVLREGGLVFLVENTEPQKNQRHIAFRTREEYRALFPFAPLRWERDYRDRGERISIMTGRKGQDAPGA